MNNTVTVERGLVAHFKQASGPSRAGVDWLVRIGGTVTGTVIVRTYFSSNAPDKAEQRALADKAVALVYQELQQGWTPQSGTRLEID